MSNPALFFIPAGENGDKYLKLITGDETMTVAKYSEKLERRHIHNLLSEEGLSEKQLISVGNIVYDLIVEVRLYERSLDILLE